MTEIENFSTSYHERDEQDFDELVEETQMLIRIAHGNIEYILGNGDFGVIESEFHDVEQMYNGLASMNEHIADADYELLEQR